jgi:peptide/nickel transport system permease protein
MASDPVTIPTTSELEAISIESRSPLQLAWRRFRKHKMAMVGVGILFLLVVYVTIGGMLLSKGYCAPLSAELRYEAWANCTDTSKVRQPPSNTHPFGTDSIGRDILARTIYGGQISILIGVTAATVGVILGTLIGAVAAYYGGFIDSILMRFTEAMLNIPSLFLLIVAAKFFSGKIPDINILGRQMTGNVVFIILIIGLTSWMYLARIVRANVLSLRELDYVAAARALGSSNARIILAHLLPNTLAPIIVSATLGVAGAILSEAYVSFLGLGIPSQITATWGNMLDGSYQYLETAPWLWFFPGTFILLTVLSINFIGDGLRDAFDPRSIRHL